MNFFKKNLTDITIFILLQYIFMAVVLMYLYNGGNVVDAHSKEYVWNINLLNDLGRTVFYNGQKNIFWLYYSLSLFLIGIGIMLFFYLISRLLETTKLRNLIMILGVISGLGYIIMAFSPININPVLNLAASKVGLFAFISAIFVLNLFLDKDKYRFLYYNILIFNILLIIALFYQSFMLEFNKPDFIIKYMAVMQKIIVFFQLVFASFVLYYIKKRKLYF